MVDRLLKGAHVPIASPLVVVALVIRMVTHHDHQVRILSLHTVTVHVTHVVPLEHSHVTEDIYCRDEEREAG
jgi:hypothetical protein